MTTEIKNLLDKPVWQMTGKEFYQLACYALEGNVTTGTTKGVCVTGVHALAEYLDCCDSTVYALKRNGVLDGAVISQIGRKIVFDGEKARELAVEYLKGRRASHV